MPRRQPRRSSHASTGSYTSFFGRSSRGSNSSSSSALSSSSSQSPSPPASPAVLTPAPVQVTPPAPSTRSSPNDSTASSSKKKQPNPQAIAEIEETLEALFQGAPGPVHSLKSVELKQKKQLDIDMREAGMERTLRAWWIKRQFAEKRGDGPSKKSEDSKPSSAANAKVDRSSPQVKASPVKASTSKASPSHKKPRPVVKKEKSSSSVKIAKSSPSVQSNDSPIASSSSKVMVEEPSISPIVSKAPSPSKQVSPTISLSSPSSAKPSAFSSAAFSVKPDPGPSPLREPLGGLPIVQSHSSPSLERIEDIVSPFEVPQAKVVAFPALTLLIGTWARRSAVDPTQLSFKYSGATDSFVFSTQHLDCTYHLNLPLESVASLILFHSLTYSRSVLLIYRDRLSTFLPHFSLTSPAHQAPIPLSQDFTPAYIASTHPIYALELTETSSIPSLFEKIESLSPSLDLDQKLFVGPWDPEVLDFEDLATSLVAQRKRAGEEDVWRFEYQGKDAIRAMEDVWVRRWTSKAGQE